MPKKNSVHPRKVINTNVQGLSNDPTNGDKNWVNISGGNTSKNAKLNNLIAINVPTIITVVGINSKDLETKSGTLSGIRIVKFFFLHHLYSSTANIPDTIAINKPLVPKYLITIPPSSVKLNTNKRNPTAPRTIAPGTYNL